MTIKRKLYVRPMTSIWWKKLPFYHFYILCEDATAPAVWFSIRPIFELFTLKNDPEAWAGLVDFLQNPVTVIIDLITLAAVLLYTKTRFELAPKAANIIAKDEKVGLEPIIESLWAVTVVATIVILSITLYWQGA